MSKNRRLKVTSVSLGLLLFTCSFGQPEVRLQVTMIDRSQLPYDLALGIRYFVTSECCHAIWHAGNPWRDSLDIVAYSLRRVGFEPDT